MKNSLKISAIALAFTAFAFTAKAQTIAPSTTTTAPSGVRFSIGVDAGIPTGNLSNSYNWNLGGSVQADIPVISNQLFVTVNAATDPTVNGFEKEIAEFGKCFGTADLKEGVSAFLEKRKAEFKGE